MLTHLDHLVILVRDLERAVADYEQLGFIVTPGGTHADGLTRNALIVFGDGAYLELIAFVDPEDRRDNVWGWRRFLASGGLIDYCVASNDLVADVQAFRARGLTVSDPTDGGRRRPDGTELRWRSAHFWQAGRELPFLIEDVTPRELRVPGGDARQHPNGVSGIRELIIAVADVQRLSGIFSTLLNSSPPDSVIDRRRDALTASFALPPHRLMLAAPMDPNSAIRLHMERTGIGPFEVTLHGAPVSHPKLLNLQQTHGARIWLV